MSELEKLEDAKVAIKEIVADISSGPWEASTQPLGYVTVRGRKAQVQVRVTLDEYEFVEK